MPPILPTAQPPLGLPANITANVQLFSPAQVGKYGTFNTPIGLKVTMPLVWDGVAWSGAWDQSNKDGSPLFPDYPDLVHLLIGVNFCLNGSISSSGSYFGCGVQLADFTPFANGSGVRNSSGMLFPEAFGQVWSDPTLGIQNWFTPPPGVASLQPVIARATGSATPIPTLEPWYFGQDYNGAYWYTYGASLLQPLISQTPHSNNYYPSNAVYGASAFSYVLSTIGFQSPTPAPGPYDFANPPDFYVTDGPYENFVYCPFTMLPKGYVLYLNGLDIFLPQ